MNRQKKLLIAGLLLLAVSVTSSAIASHISVADVDGRPNWNAFNGSILLMILVTIPTLCASIVLLGASLLLYVKKSKKSN